MATCPKCKQKGVIHYPSGICTRCCIDEANFKINVARKGRVITDLPLKEDRACRHCNYSRLYRVEKTGTVYCHDCGNVQY